MDTIFAQPVQEIPAQQVPVPPKETFTSMRIEELPQKKRSLRKVFNISSWVVLFALLPVTVLIFLSQDTIPGDFFYPVKRSLENVVLAAASVSPVTKAAFRTDLTEARFKEAQGLIVSKSNASGLSTFIDEVQGAKQEVASLKNDTERGKAEEKLINKLEEYQAGLSTLEAKTEQTIIAYQFQEIPTPIPTPTPTLVPTTTLAPTSTPVKQASSASSEASAPTLILTPTTAPTLPSQPENAQVSEQRRIVITIKETKEKLDKIKKDLEEKKKEREEGRNETEKNQKKNENNQNESEKDTSGDKNINLKNTD